MAIDIDAQGLAIKAHALAHDALYRQELLLGAIGDSRIQQAISDSGRSYTFRSILYWMQSLSGGRARFDPALIDGVSGDTSAEALARLPGLIDRCRAAQADGIVWYAATNDPGNGLLPSDTEANMAAAAAMTRNAGLLLFVIVETPRGYTGTGLPYPAPGALAYPDTEPLRGYHLQNMAMQRRLRRYPGVYVIDAVDRLVDNSRDDGCPRQDLFYDGLHPGPGASFHIGRAFVEQLSGLVSATPVLAVAQGDVHKISNLYGNHLLDGMMLGTGGAADANVSGDVPDYGNASTTDPAMTAVMSRLASADVSGVPQYWQQIVIGGDAPTTASPTFRLTLTATSAGPVPDGCLLEGGIEVEVDAGASHIQSIGLMLNGGGADFTSIGALPGDNGDMPDMAWSGILRTPRLTVPVGGISARNLSFTITGRQGYAASATVRIRRATLRRTAA